MSVEYNHIDMETSKIKGVDADGSQFLVNYLIPAWRRLSGKRRGRPAVVIHDGLAVTFKIREVRFHTGEGDVPTEIWVIRVGRNLTRNMAEQVGAKIVAAFVAWGYPRVHGLWLFSDDKPFLLEVHLPARPDKSGRVGRAVDGLV